MIVIGVFITAFSLRRFSRDGRDGRGGVKVQTGRQVRGRRREACTCTCIRAYMCICGNNVHMNTYIGGDLSYHGTFKKKKKYFFMDALQYEIRANKMNDSQQNQSSKFLSANLRSPKPSRETVIRWISMLSDTRSHDGIASPPDLCGQIFKYWSF
jgi:hypothetical protein